MVCIDTLTGSISPPSREVQASQTKGCKARQLKLSNGAKATGVTVQPLSRDVSETEGWQPVPFRESKRQDGAYVIRRSPATGSDKLQAVKLQSCLGSWLAVQSEGREISVLRSGIRRRCLATRVQFSRQSICSPNPGALDSGESGHAGRVALCGMEVTAA